MNSVDMWIILILSAFFSAAVFALLALVLVVIRRFVRGRWPQLAISRWSFAELALLTFAVVTIANGYIWIVGQARAWSGTAILLVVTATYLVLLMVLVLPYRLAGWSLVFTIVVTSGSAAIFTNWNCLEGGSYRDPHLRLFIIGGDERKSPDQEHTAKIFQHGCDEDAHEQGQGAVSVVIDKRAVGFDSDHEVFRVERGLAPTNIDTWWEGNRELVISYLARDSPVITVQETSWRGITITYMPPRSICFLCDQRADVGG